MSALVSIYNETTSAWVDLPCPSSYNGTVETLVDSARNSKGQVIGNVILSGVGKVEITWNFLTCQQYSKIAKLFEPTYGGAFYNKVKFFDAISNDWQEREMYVGNRTWTTAKMVLNSDGSPKGYTSVKLSLIDTGKRDT